MKFYFRSESFKKKFSLILFVDNLIIGCSEKNVKNYLKKALGLVLLGLQTTASDYKWVPENCQGSLMKY